MSGTTWARSQMRGRWRRPPGWREEGERWLEASLLLTLLPPLPPPFNSQAFLAFSYSLSSLLLCAKMTSSHVVDLFVDRSVFVYDTSKSASLWSDGPDLSKPALYQHCHSQDLVALKGHLSGRCLHPHPVWPETESALASAHIHSEKEIWKLYSREYFYA